MPEWKSRIVLSQEISFLKLATIVYADIASIYIITIPTQPRKGNGPFQNRICWPHGFIPLFSYEICVPIIPGYTIVPFLWSPCYCTQTNKHLYRNIVVFIILWWQWNICVHLMRVGLFSWKSSIRYWSNMKRTSTWADCIFLMTGKNTWIYKQASYSNHLGILIKITLMYHFS